jgi:YegS/Rv2252/BmrU family lipid kinase
MEASNVTQQSPLATDTDHMSAVIIANPTSGSFPHHHHNHTATLAFLKARGWQVELCFTTGPGDARRLARRAVEDDVSLVIAAGGDGTINEVIQELAGSETALGVLPMGTVNVWAREVGIPLDHARAREILVHGQTRRIDLGRANDRYFLLMIGIGVDGEVAQAVEHKPLKRLGVLGYTLAALWFGTGYLGFPLTLKIDSSEPVRTRALQVVIGNTQLYAGAFKFTWLARCNDGLLDLCLVHKHGPLGRLIILFDLLLKREGRRQRVRYNTLQEVLIETRNPVAIQIDGEPAGSTPTRVTVVPGALKVIVPQVALPDLFA